MRVFIMEWTERELKEIEAVIKALNYALMVARGEGVKLDIENEQVLFIRDGKCIKKISVSGDNARGVFSDVVKALSSDL